MDWRMLIKNVAREGSSLYDHCAYTRRFPAFRVSGPPLISSVPPVLTRVDSLVYTLLTDLDRTAKFPGGYSMLKQREEKE